MDCSGISPADKPPELSLWEKGELAFQSCILRFRLKYFGKRDCVCSSATDQLWKWTGSLLTEQHGTKSALQWGRDWKKNLWISKVKLFYYKITLLCSTHSSAYLSWMWMQAAIILYYKENTKKKPQKDIPTSTTDTIKTGFNYFQAVLCHVPQLFIYT